MSGSSVFVILLFVVEMASVESQTPGLLSLSSGSSLSVDKENDFLISPNGSFSSGFYEVGTNAYCYSIWFTNSLNRTVVWMANRDKPVNGKLSKLTLHKNGNLVLTDADGSIAWSTHTFSQATVEARLLETGNLVLINQANEIIWESFGFPTDTLLPTQPLVKNTTLVSMRNRGIYLSGFYNFKFVDANVLNLVYNGPLVSSVYWPSTAVTVFISGRTTYDSSRLAFLNVLGLFRSSDNFSFSASDYGAGPKRRLTIDYDGMLRLYSLDESSGLWQMSWSPAGVDSCQIHGLCGPYGVCVYDPLPACSCPYGFDRNDPSDWSKGCSPRFNLTCNPLELDFIDLLHTDYYYGYDISYGVGMTLEACRNTCLNNCGCKGFAYSLKGEGNCYQKSVLLNGYRMTSFPNTIYIKVPRGMVIPQADIGQLRTNQLNCSATETVLGGDHTGKEDKNKSWYLKYLIAFVASIAIIEMLFVGLGWWYVFRKHAHEELVNLGYMVLAAGFKSFSFAELKRATRNYKEQIGKGGFGTVYKGILGDDRVVAVKRLEGISQGETEFWAEVSTIGKLNHKNLVTMRGFCAEGKHKLLVYDYMENGSLDTLLFSSSSRTLGLDQRYNIALGTAKGLAYIHEECLEWVLHCDVKPQNILLDHNLEPKVTDFGMSKLFGDSNNLRFSRVRGTRGYLAPEWMMNLKINAKADVYSYGVVLLELVSGKSASGFHLDEAQENKLNHLVHWARQRFNQEGLKGVVDPRLNNEFEYEKLERLTRVALLCVAEDRDMRPAMSKVVELLTGDGESNFNPSEEIID